MTTLRIVRSLMIVMVVNLSLVPNLFSAEPDHGAVLSGELKRWHKTTLTFDGPETSETATPNPFLDYRLDVTFTMDDRSFLVPGYYAADGDAANTSAATGNKWRVNFTPDAIGTWSWTASFRTGAGVAIDHDPLGGVSAGFFDGATGTFGIDASDKTGDDFRADAKGRLEYVGEHALYWRGGDGYFFKAGLNHPEVFLEYEDFDNTASTRSYSAHVGAWQIGDPLWQGTKGAGIIGAINYLASEEMNVHYFIVMNSRGDGQNAFPWNASEDVWSYDISKLEQWQMVMDHMMTRGVMAHILFTEQENQSLFEYLAAWPASGFADSRKLFFREMVARFGHLNALTWNIGEESGLQAGGITYGKAVNDAQRKDFADWLRSLTHYHDHIVVHNGGFNNDAIFSPLIGHDSLTGPSIQGHYTNPAHGHDRIQKWRITSAAYGHKWVVTYDEPYSDGTPDRDTWRKNNLWASLLAGGAGIELYSGLDQSLEDYTIFSPIYADLRIARQFLKDNAIPFQAMVPEDTLVSSGWCLAAPGHSYVVYLISGGTAELTIAGGTFRVLWLDPRNGGPFLDGSVTTITGAGSHSLGEPPNSPTEDWVVYVRNTEDVLLYSLSVGSGTGSGGYAADGVARITANTPPAGQEFDRWTGDTATVADVNAAVSSLTMPAADINVTATYRPDGRATVSFQVTEDAYLQGTTRFNDSTLKVEAGYRVSYLKFTVSGLSGNMQSATLLLQENGDPGNGTLRVYRGSHNNWTETTLSTVTAPVELDQVGTFTGAIASGQIVAIDVTPLITVEGTYSVILKMDAGGNDVWFGSDESIRKTQLVLETAASDIVVYNLTVNSGLGSGDYAVGSTVNIDALAAPTGQEFDRWTGDTEHVSDVSAASTSVTMPPTDVTVTPTYRSASGGAFSFQPTDDAYLQGSTRFNDPYLKVEAGYRVSYLKFSVSGLSGTVQNATLRLQENGDIGNGTLRVHRGSHNSWTETTLSTANAPVENGQVGVFTGAVDAGQIVNIDITPLITGNGTYSLILMKDPDGNDVWFGSDESTRIPQLIIEPTPGGTITYSLTVNSGLGSGNYAAGSTVNIDALAAPIGQEFDQWTGDTEHVSDVSAASTSVTMPPTDVTITATYRAISGGASSFQPTDDAYLQGSTRFNDNYLKVEAGYRVSYLKFSVSGLSGTVQNATLRLQENGDPGTGTLRVVRGSHNNWTETTLSTANAPVENGQVGSFTGTVVSGQIVSIDITPLITGNGTVSVILMKDTGGNDIWFGSEESPRKPQLVIETTDGDTASYNLAVNGGTGSGNYTAGSTVNIDALAAPAGQEFDRWTGDTEHVSDVSAASTSVTMPPTDVTVTATYRAISGGALSFQPTDDAYLQGTTRFNDPYLKVEAGYRVSYLKFTVSGLSGTVRNATLRLQENGDIGNGTLRVYRGSHNSWTETTLSTANAPVENGQVGVFTGAVDAGQIVNIDITPLITGNGTYSLILMKDPDGNDVWFGSDESTRIPQLIIEPTSADPITLSLSLDDTDSGEHSGLPLQLMAHPASIANVDLLSQASNGIESQFPPRPPRIQISRLGPAEVVIHCDVNGNADLQVQMRTSWPEGEWVTIPWDASSSGRLSIPVVVGSTNAFFRLGSE